MGTRTFAQVPPTAATIALNAYIFGYAGHSLVTPHAALKQLWWTDDRIERKVTRQFVVSQIRGEEREFLDKPLAFGEGLTDDTYMEWILDRARRLFLILAEIGKPEQIFGLIDDSFDDDDVPLSSKTIRRLELSVEPDDKMDKRFYDTQFLYLLRQLKADAHIDYGPNEYIPMEYVHKLPPAVPLQCWDRIHFPNMPEQVYLRRKFVFGSDDSQDQQRIEYTADISKAKNLKHEHICPIWASYTSGKSGFVLSDFVPEHTLGSFIAQRLPYQFMRVSAAQRPVMVLEWLHCLSDALASLHHRGTSHGAIRPSNVVIDNDNRIAFSDVGVLRTFQKGKKVDKKEMSEYAAPEVYVSLITPPHSNKTRSKGAKAIGDDHSSSSGGSIRSNSVWSTSSPPSSPMTGSMPFSPSTPHHRTFRNFSRHLSQQSTRPLSPLPLSIENTFPRPPPTPTEGTGASLASIIAAATSPITTITPSLPPPTPEEMSPTSPHLSPWYSRPSSPSATPTRPDFKASAFSFSRSKTRGNPEAPQTPTRTGPLSFSFSSLKKSPSTSHLPPLSPIASSAPTHISSVSDDTSNKTSSSASHPPKPATNPEAADIFSLGCVFLDVLTWLVKGRITSFQRFRAAPTPEGCKSGDVGSVRSTRSMGSFMSYRTSATTRVSSSSLSNSGGGGLGGSGGGGAKGAEDPAFAVCGAAGKLDIWIDDLIAESLAKFAEPKGGTSRKSKKGTGAQGVGHDRHGVGGSGGPVKAVEETNEAIWANGVPQLLGLVRDMLSEDAAERPTTTMVRDKIEEVLVKGCCFERLCCTDRVWESGMGDEERKGPRRGAKVARGWYEGETEQQASAGAEVGMAFATEEERRVDMAVVAKDDLVGQDIGVGLGIHYRSKRVAEGIATDKASAAPPVTKRKISLPWRKR